MLRSVVTNLVVGRSTTLFFAQCIMAFGFDAADTAGGSRACGLTWLCALLLDLEALSHTFKSRFPIGILRTTLGCSDGSAGRAMNEAHTCLDFIAILATWSAGNEEIQVTVAH